jgi:NAD(P)-dependent dehydrogenase (short-subunit alcohol dehydrogenase family)
MGREDGPLAGKVIVITGASSGVGKAAAISFAEKGADLVVGARSDAPRDDGLPSLVDTRREAEAAGARCVAVRVDVSVDDDIAALARRTGEEFGRVDVLVNNAAVLGASMNEPIDVMSAASWRYQIAVNLTAPWLAITTFLPLFPATGGIVVNTTSGPMPGEPPIRRAPGQGFPGAAYPTSKAALNRMTDVLGNELRGRSIAVVAFHPGRARTERNARSLAAAGYDPDDWQDVAHAVATLDGIVTHRDPMSLTGTVVYTPQAPRTQA